MNIIDKILKKRIWKEVRREVLGPLRPNSVGQPMHRVAVHEKCLLTGKTRIREIHVLGEECGREIDKTSLNHGKI